MYALPSGGLSVSGTIAKLWNQYLTGLMRATRFIRVDSSAKMHISTAGDGSILGAEREEWRGGHSICRFHRITPATNI